jgi:hypothetical protein
MDQLRSIAMDKIRDERLTNLDELNEIEEKVCSVLARAEKEEDLRSLRSMIADFIQLKGDTVKQV